MRNSAVIVALSALGLAAAAENFTIDPDDVSLTTRSNWCTAQSNTCITLCDNNPKANSCDPTTLNYTCTCQNGSAPGLQYYLQTMPTFICEEAYAECNSENAGSAAGQSNCTTSIQDECGTLNPDNYTAAAATTTSSSSTASATGKAASGTASGSTSSPTTTSSKAGAMPTAMSHYGNGAAAVALGLFAYLL